MTQRVFILLGMPGVGKGTQAEHLAKACNLFHIDTGHALRSEIALGTELGQTAQNYMSQGQLVPFDLVMQVIKATIERIPSEQAGFLFDGFPRNLQQAEGLNTLLAELNLPITAVLYLETAHDILMDRLAYRVSCGSCGAKYNTRLNPPKTEGVCDACGHTEFVQRADDKPDVIENRLKAYETETSPLIAYYEAKGLMHRVNANQAIDTVFGEIMTEVQPFFEASASV